MKKISLILLTLLVGFGLLTSCQKEEVKPNDKTINQITPSRIVLQIENTSLSLKATIIYTDIDGYQKTSYDNIVENINWDEEVIISASSGFTLYGPSGSIWSPEPTTFKLYKDNQLIDIKTNSSYYDYSNK